LDALLPGDLPALAGQGTDHVAVHAAAGGVVQHDVAAGRADAAVHVTVDGGVAGGAVVGPARMQCDHAGARVPAAHDVVGDLVRLGGQVRVLRLVGHAAGGGDGHDDFAFGHGGSGAWDGVHGRPSPVGVQSSR